jgi:hypothetical protein
LVFTGKRRSFRILRTCIIRWHQGPLYSDHWYFRHCHLLSGKVRGLRCWFEVFPQSVAGTKKCPRSVWMRRAQKSRRCHMVSRPSFCNFKLNTIECVKS